MRSIDKLIGSNKAVFLFLFFLGLLLFGLVIGGPFIFDDDLLIINNRLIRSLGNFFSFFTSSSTAGAYLGGSNFYRPLQTLTYALTYQFFGLNPSVYHLISITIHIINSFLVFLFIHKLSFSRLGSLLAAVIFLIHPAQVEAVSYISGLADPLGVMFLLLGLLQSRLILSFAFFVLALLSKESTVVFFPLVALVTFYGWNRYSEEERSFKIKSIIAFAALAFVYLYLKFTALSFTGTAGLTPEANLYTANLHVRLITFITILWEYFKLLLLPIQLYLERPYVAFTTLLTPPGVFGLLVIITGLIAAYYSVRRDKIVALGFFWFFIGLLPVSGVIPLNAIYLEHWLYLPIIGLLILLAASYDWLRSEKSKTIFVCAFAVVAILFSARTIMRNSEWADTFKFYKNEITYTQTSARIYNNLAMAYADIGEHSPAIEHYEKAITVRDIYPQTHHNLANSYRELGQVDEAINEYFLALRLDSNFIYSHAALYNIYLSRQQPKKAEQFAQFITTIQGGGAVTFEQIEKVRDER